MELISAITGLFTLLFAFGSLSVFLTFPSWLMGRLSRNPRRLRDSTPLNVVVETPRRRWLLWLLTSTVAFVGLYQLIMPHFTNLTLGVPLLLIGIAGAHWSAFQIGRAKTEVKQVPPAGEQALGAVPFEPEPPMPTPVPTQATTPTAPLPTTPIPEQGNESPYGPDAATEEYPLASPTSDPYRYE